MLLESGPTSTILLIQQVMKYLGIIEISGILPTHIHIDHAGAIRKLAGLFPKTKVLLHPKGVKHVCKPVSVDREY